jgi:hypothetical protein
VNDARGGRAPNQRLLDIAWFLTFAVGSSLWCLTAARAVGPTFDEPVYLNRGLEGWRSGSHAGLLRMGTMPLAIDLATLPLYVRERAGGAVPVPDRDLGALLPTARATMLVFWWILLFYGDRAGRLFAGAAGGRLAVTMLAVEPVLLGHASFATTDVSVTACLVALVYHFLKGRGGGFASRIGAPAFWYGAALLAKASALLFGPVALLAAAGERGVRRLVRETSAVVLLGLAVAFFYCGSDWKPLPSFIAWAEALPEGAGATAMRAVAENLKIFSNAGEGLGRQVKHGIRGHGHGAYLLGEVRESFWYYFPAALGMKVSLPLLGLPLVLLAFRPAALANGANRAALALLLLSITARVQIGVRFFLPVIALAAVGLAASTVVAARSVRRPLRIALVAAVVCGVAWNARSASAVWPHGLCYTNELWGGAERSHLLLSDSNCDWGQGLGDLERWHREHGGLPLDVWYFGTDPALRTMPVRSQPFHQLPITAPGDVIGRVRGRHLAVSTTLVHGTPLNESHRVTAVLLRSREPVARTQTFFIYDFTDPQAR